VPAHRKPVELKLIDGTYRPDRANTAAPRPVRTSTMSAPKHLSPRARKQWTAVVKMLDSLGVLTVADAMAVESLCETYADLVEARIAIRDAGGPSYEATTKAGGTMYRARPEVGIVSDADKRLRAWLAEFGLTPAARNRVSASATPDDDDPFADL